MAHLTVVVPVYNARLFLAECIDSILAQSFHNFELILVNDGSNDESGKICDDYAMKDGRIQVIHQLNGGVTAARSNGVKNAKGEWITFVDADDTLPVDALKTMMEDADDNTDIVIARYDNETYPESISLDDYRRCCISGQKIHSAPFARAFRLCIFDDKTFDIPREIIRGEDLIMNVRLAFATEKDPKLINKKVYNYRQNESSVMHTFKETYEHMVLFQQCLKESIPLSVSDEYAMTLLSSRMGSLITFATDNVGDTSYKDSAYYDELKRDMSLFGVSFSFDQKLKLMARTPFFLRMVYRILKIKDKLTCQK